MDGSARSWRTRHGRSAALGSRLSALSGPPTLLIPHALARLNWTLRASLKKKSRELQWEGLPSPRLAGRGCQGGLVVGLTVVSLKFFPQVPPSLWPMPDPHPRSTSWCEDPHVETKDGFPTFPELRG